MKIPPFLKPGDTIYILSTARKIALAEVQYAVDIITNWGFKVKLGKTIGAEYNQFAGTDDERLDDMQEALDDDSVKAILCARGGYGTIRIIDEIDFRPFIKRPKWICGYSDVTILHDFIYSMYDVATLHCTMPLNMPNNTAQSMYSVKQALTGEPYEIAGEPHPFNRSGNLAGPVIGGNLSLLHNLNGTSGELDTAGKILFIEDVDEYLYHIDRMMWQLGRSGKLDRLAALVVGTMIDMKDNTIPFGQDAYEIIASHVDGFSYPVCYNMPIGHETDNRSIIHAGVHELFIDEEGGLLRWKP